MRVLILVDCYYPSMKSGAKLVHDLAVELSQRGFQAIVLTPSDAITDKAEIRTEDGCTVVRVRTGKIKGAGKIQRAIREARLSADLWHGAMEFLRKNRCDLIVFYSPTIFFGPLVRRLKRLWKCPAYLILRDIFPDWAVDAGVLKEAIVYRYFRRVALAQYRVADLIAVQSPANLTYLERRCAGERFKLKVLFNWTASRESALPTTNYREQLGLTGKQVFLYGGNIGVAQDMDNILRLACRLKSRQDIQFLLIGEGSEVPRLRKTIEREDLTNVRIISGIPQEEYLAMVSEFDFGLISLHARLTSHNVPGKLLSYLYWGLPVLASVNPANDLFDLLHENRAGLCVQNGYDDDLLQAALRLANDRALCATMRRNARRLLESTFSVENAVSQIFEHLREFHLLPVESTSFIRRTPVPGFTPIEVPDRP